MEMEMEVRDDAGIGSLLERLSAAAGALEQAAERLAQIEIQAEAAASKAARKTGPTGVSTLVAKDGTVAELGALDAALTSLSLEQRIAVKSQLLRSGLIG